MFSLIVTLVAIALVAALALATLYFGGSAFTGGGEAAVVARVLNEGAQIQGAAVMHHVEQGAYAPDVATLVSAKYLAAAPSGAHWTAYQDTAVLEDLPETQCLALNKKLGLSSVPSCADPAIVGATVCCELAP